MSEYGVKIKSIQAGSIHELNCGVRQNLDCKDAMLTNSLFLDFLINNGLSIWKGESTRDVVSIAFDYGSRSYEQEKKHLRKMMYNAQTEEKKKQVQELIEFADNNVEKYDQKSKQELRTMFYRDGVNVIYNTRNKSGEIIKTETVLYRMLYRTPGKAKQGMCYFICDRLYKKARDFLYMGIKLPEENAPIVEIGAYSSLITSTIVGRIKIDPGDVLILKDYKAPFVTDVVSIEINDDHECIAVHRNNYEVTNEMFDGQALIDTSVFPDWGDGYVLLRQHMTKCAAFHAYIQKYFKEYCEDTGIDYDTFEVKDMWGNKHLAKNIKLITTNNAIKWVKFGVTYEQWCKKVRENGSLFGVVKTSHASKLGDVQQMSYQMINALNLDTMDNVISPTMEYIKQLQFDDDAFLEFLDKNKNFSNDYEVLIALANHNRRFILSEYFRDRRLNIIQRYVRNMKSGKLIQNADNLTLVGNPYGMLIHAVGLDPSKDPTFEHEDGCIQCYTARFDNDEYLAEFRNPFNSKENLGYLHNRWHPYFKKYFNLGKQIIAVNVNGTDFCDRNNGSDFDSDSIYTTNHPDIVSHAKYCYSHHHTIVNNIPKESKSYKNTIENYALIDNNLAKAQTAIGESSNLAQICLTYTYNFKDQKYKDYVCILAVLAQAAIDNCKRTYDIDIPSEIRRIKKDMNIDENGHPLFWKIIRPEFKGTINEELQCPMNSVVKTRRSRSHYIHPIPNEEFFIKYERHNRDKRKCKKVEKLIQNYSLKLFGYNYVSTDDNSSDYLLLRDDFDKMVNDIRQTHLSRNYLGLMSWLIDKCLLITEEMKLQEEETASTLRKNRALLLKTLYSVNSDQFLQCFKSGE